MGTNTMPTNISAELSGVHGFMLKVYGYMAAALVITGLVAYLVPQSSVLMNALYVYYNGKAVALQPLSWFLMILPLAISIYLGYSLPDMSWQTAEFSFWAYSVLLGVSLSVIFIIYSGQVIASAFFIAASIFVTMALIGYLTQRDLGTTATFLTMGLVGLIVASVANMLLQSTELQFALSIVGVFLFAGLTAYDTHNLKSLYAELSGDPAWEEKIAIMGALSLYLNFINITLNALNLLRGRSR